MVKTSAMPSYWLMKSEPERVLHRRSGARQGRHHTLGRGAQLPGPQLAAQRDRRRRRRALLSLQRRPAGRRRHGARRPRRLPRSDAVRSARQALRSREPARRSALVRRRHQVREQVRAPGDVGRAARRARSRGDGAAAPRQPAVGAAGDAPASGSRSSRWARRQRGRRQLRRKARRHEPHSPDPAHARRPSRRDPGARSGGDGGVLRRRAGPAGAAAVAGRGRRALDLVRPPRRRLPGDRARRRRAASRATAGTPTTLGIHLVALAIERGTRDAWEAHLTAAGHPIVHHTDYTLYVRDPEGNRVGLSHWPDERRPKRSNSALRAAER